LKKPSENKKHLIVFDVEGVLIPKNRFIYEAGKSLGIFQLMKMLFIGFLYETGILSLKTALNHVFYLMRGIGINSLIEIFNKIPTIPNLQNIFMQLKDRNFKIALISSGLPYQIVKKLGDTLGADYAYGIEIGLENELLSGEISGDVIEDKGKLMVFKKILSTEGFIQTDCVVVGDDRNNNSIFLPKVHKIGFNPDFILRVKADTIVNGNLSGIIPIIDNEEKIRSSLSKNDLLREIIHASGFFVPVLASFIGIIYMSLLIFAIMLVYFVSELLRMNRKDFPVVSFITRNTVSKSERYAFAAAPLYFALGILLTLLLFPNPASSAAIAIFALGDSAASVFGGRISKKPFLFNKDKTLEGTLIGFFFAFFAALFFVSPPIAVLGAALAMLFEYLPLPLNDNLVIPLFTGFILSLVV
jgi:dolichol kinase/2-hydroxy-3-keto-5-methylthiopentenyl-1-phosphate phosphatase